MEFRSWKVIINETQICKTLTMQDGQSGSLGESTPFPLHWERPTPCDHTWVISVILPVCFIFLWFNYLCHKKICNYTVTRASLNQNWAGLHGFIFWLFFGNSYHSPKETFQMCSFPNFPMKIYLTPLFLPVLLGSQAQWKWVAHRNVLANVETVAG